MRPEATLDASASKLDPRPESRTPMRFFMQAEISTVTLALQKMKPLFHVGKSVGRLEKAAITQEMKRLAARYSARVPV
jgi:hypothetical protein